MDKTKPSATGTSDGTIKGEHEVSSHSKDVVARRRLHIRMIQNVLLVWLDSIISMIATLIVAIQS
jgi:hypothetical protein